MRNKCPAQDQKFSYSTFNQRRCEAVSFFRWRMIRSSHFLMIFSGVQRLPPIKLRELILEKMDGVVMDGRGGRILKTPSSDLVVSLTILTIFNHEYWISCCSFFLGGGEVGEDTGRWELILRCWSTTDTIHGQQPLEIYMPTRLPLFKSCGVHDDGSPGGLV